MKYYLMTPALGIVTMTKGFPTLNYTNDPKAELFDDIELARKTGKSVLVKNGLKIIWIINDENDERIETVRI